MVLGVILGTLASALGGVAIGNFLGNGSSGGSVISGGFIEGFTKKDVTTNNISTVDAPFNFTQISPTSVTETTIISGSPNTNFSTKKEGIGATATPVQSIVPSQIGIAQAGGSGGDILGSLRPYLLLGGVGFLAYTVIKKK